MKPLSKIGMSDGGCLEGDNLENIEPEVLFNILTKECSSDSICLPSSSLNQNSIFF